MNFLVRFRIVFFLVIDLVLVFDFFNDILTFVDYFIPKAKSRRGTGVVLYNPGLDR